MSPTFAFQAPIRSTTACFGILSISLYICSQKTLFCLFVSIVCGGIHLNNGGSDITPCCDDSIFINDQEIKLRNALLLNIMVTPFRCASSFLPEYSRVSPVSLSAFAQNRPICTQNTTFIVYRLTMRHNCYCQKNAAEM